MRFEINRLLSFKNWKYPSPESLSKYGFFCIGNGRAQCFCCRGIVKDWEETDDALEEHERHFPRCPFIMEYNVYNVPINKDPFRDPATTTVYSFRPFKRLRPKTL